ncbi:MAG: methyltransferase domain-containing protein [Coriobacteriia bacterium]|nr:methyltransferase domain-containing protein [Coriobacteriia bacterium]
MPIKKVNTEVLALLRCPICQSELHEDALALVCENNHSFDRSKLGYVTLLSGDAIQNTADNLDMVFCRQRFHTRNYYKPFAQKLADEVAAVVPSTGAIVADIGAGTGYYSAVLTRAIPGIEIVDFDLSKRALQRAVQLSSVITAIVADTWAGLPVKDEAFDALINVFAPRNAEDFARIVKPGGYVFVSTPTPKHLLEIREAAHLIRIGRQDSDKKADLREKMIPYFDLVKTETIEFPLAFDERSVYDLVMMGPNAYHTDGDELLHVIGELQRPIEATFSVDLHTYRKQI